MFTRGFCLFAAVFTLSNVVASALGGASASIWWIDLRSVPKPFDIGLEILAAAALLVAARRPADGRIRRAAGGVLMVVASVAAGNALTVWQLQAAGAIDTGPVPMSMLVAVVMVVIAASLWKSERIGRRQTRRRALAGLASGVVAGAVALPSAQMLFFGSSDYRSAAPSGATTAIVVFGAGVRANGTPSQALYDRVMTACALYHQGCGGVLVVSGGPGPGDVHETTAMKALAIAQGVPESAIAIDTDGLDTQATARNSTRLLRSRGIDTAIAVSHGYHLPRVKLAFRQQGVEVYTVPAEQSRTLSAMPIYVAREVPALWVYWARGLIGR